MDEKFKDLQSKIAAVCRHRTNFQATRDFPMELWQDLGREGLMGIVVPKAYNGMGHGLDALACAAEELGVQGAPMGFTLAFVIHHLVCHHFIHTHGSRRLWDDYLPAMARGKLTAAIAVSEPGVGAHPKHLTTRAVKAGNDVIINGEKSVVTNAPLADLFIIVAVTGVREQRNLFSALVVPRNTPGLLPGAPMEMNFLHPCLHSTLSLEECRVKANRITGKPGLAYETMVVPFRRLEQCLVPAIVSGATAGQTRQLAALSKGGMENPEIPALDAMVCRLSHLARNTVNRHMNDTGNATVLREIRAFARAAGQYRESVRQMIEQQKIFRSKCLDEFDRDLSVLLGLFAGD